LIAIASSQVMMIYLYDDAVLLEQADALMAVAT
jgi:hypothetical protein